MTSRSCDGHLVQEGAQQRRLPGARAAGHDDVPPGSDGGAQERGQLVVDHPPRGELVERRELEPVPADHDARPSRHLHRREQPAAVGQLQVQLGVGGIEPALAASHARRHQADELDQLVVAVGDRLAGHPRAVVELEPHRVAATDVDVGDVGRVEVGLDPPEAHAPRPSRRRTGPARRRRAGGPRRAPGGPTARRSSSPAARDAASWRASSGDSRDRPDASRSISSAASGLTDVACELHRPGARSGPTIAAGSSRDASFIPPPRSGPAPSSAASSVGAWSASSRAASAAATTRALRTSALVRKRLDRPCRRSRRRPSGRRPGHRAPRRRGWPPPRSVRRAACPRAPRRRRPAPAAQGDAGRAR